MFKSTTNLYIITAIAISLTTGCTKKGPEGIEDLRSTAPGISPNPAPAPSENSNPNIMDLNAPQSKDFGDAPTYGQLKMNSQEEVVAAVASKLTVLSKGGKDKDDDNKGNSGKGGGKDDKDKDDDDRDWDKHYGKDKDDDHEHQKRCRKFHSRHGRKYKHCQDPTFTSVKINIKEVSAYNEAVGWVLLNGTPQIVDLIQISSNANVILVDRRIPPGSYKQIRLKIEGNATGTLDNGKTVSIKVPSGDRSGIKLKHQFTIEKGLITSISLNFDPERSIKELGKSGKYILHPHIRINGIEEDLVIPAIAILSPTERYSNNLVQLIEVEYADANLNLNSLSVKVNGVEVKNSLTIDEVSAKGSLTFTEGEHIISANISDLAPNEGIASPVVITVDKTAPVINLVQSYILSKSQSVSVSADLSDLLSGINSNSFKIFVDGVLQPGIPLIAGNRYTANVISSEGDHTYRIEISDRAGNITSATGSLRIDLTPPSLSLISPINGSSLYTNILPKSFEFIGSSSETLVQASINGVNADLNTNKTEFKTNLEVMNAGSLPVELRGSDLAGKEGVSQNSIEVIFDNIKPQIQIGLENNYLTKEPSVQIPIQINDISPTFSRVIVNGTEVLVTASKNYTYSADLTHEGANEIKVQAFDLAGNQADVVSLIIIRDRTPPDIQVTPSDGSTITLTMFEIRAKSNEILKLASIANKQVQLDIPKTGFSLTYIADKQGENIVEVRATDIAGNESIKSIRIFIQSELLSENLISVLPDEVDPSYLYIVGQNGSTRPGINVSASEGILSTNRGETISDSEGAFRLRLQTFSQVDLTASDQTTAESETVSISSQVETSFAGVVKDSNGTPLPNVRVSLEGDTNTFFTDSSGNFRIYTRKIGDQKLIIDGTTVPQSTTGALKYFTKTSIALYVSRNRSNTLTNPIFLAPLMLDGTEIVVGNNAVTVESPHAPNVRLEVPANSAVFPEESQSRIINMITVPSSKASLPPPDSAVPTNVIALEPSGLEFNTPAKLSLPNDNDLPPGVEMVIYSLNSRKGIWEPDGIARVSEDGSSVVTLPGKGISHFSFVFAVPTKPQIRQLFEKGSSGIDTTGGAVTTEFNLPTFNSMGSNIAPNFVYKSSWANPTAVVTNQFDIPQSKVLVDEKRISTQRKIQKFKVCHEARDIFNARYDECSWERVLFQTQTTNNINVTSFYNPEYVKAQFMLDSTSSNGQTSYSSDTTETVDFLPGGRFKNGIATPIVTLNGIPNRSVLTFALPLKTDSSSYLPTGVYSTLSRYQIKLKNLLITTITPEIKITATSSNGTTTENITRPKINPQKDPPVFDELVASDVLSSITVINKTKSAFGSGWDFSMGQKRIINPTSETPIVESGDGQLLKFQIKNSISTVLTNIGTNIDFDQSINFQNISETLVVKFESGTQSIHAINLNEPTSPSNFLAPIAQIQFQNLSSPACDTGAANGLFKLTKKSSYHEIRGILKSEAGTIYYGQSAIDGDDFLPGIHVFENGVNYLHGRSNQYETFPTFGYNDGPFLLSGYPRYVQNTREVSSSDFGVFPCNRPPSPPSETFGGQYIPTYLPTLIRDPSNVFGYSPGGPQLPSFGNSPGPIIRGPDGNIYVAADFNIFRINPSTHEAFPLSINAVRANDIVFDEDGNLFATDRFGYINKIDPNGAVIRIAGLPAYLGGSSSEEGYAPQFAFDTPMYLTYDKIKKYLYVSDTAANKVYKIDLSQNTVSTVAGTGSCDLSNLGDGGISTLASLCRPTNLGLDEFGNLFINDSGNSRIRKVTFSNSTSGPLTFLPINNDKSVLTRNENNSWTLELRNGDISTFRPDGLQTKGATTAGAFIQYNYDTENKLIEISDNVGQTSTITYSGNQIATFKDPAGRVTYFNFTGTLLTRVTFPDGSTKNYSYNPEGILSEEINQRGFSTKYFYNEIGRVNKVVDQNDIEYFLNDYQSSSLVTDYTGGNIGRFSRPGFGELNVNDGYIEPGGYATEIVRGYDGLVSSTSDAAGRITTTERDFSGKPIAVNLPGSVRIELKYNPETNDLVEIKDIGTGVVENREYSKSGKIISLKKNGIEINRTEFNTFTGLPEKIIAGSFEEVLSYNPMGLLASRSTKQRPNILETTNYEYDLKGRTSKITLPSGIIKIYERDLAGNITSLSESGPSNSLSTTRFEYDQMNRLTKVTDSRGQVTSYEYLATGELSKITDSKNKPTIFSYDKKGQLVKKIFADGTSETFAYADNGRVNDYIDRKGQRISYAYNFLGLKTKVFYPDDTVDIKYTSRDQVESISNSNSTVSFTYDTRGRTTSTTTSAIGFSGPVPTYTNLMSYDHFDFRTETDTFVGKYTSQYDPFGKLLYFSGPDNITRLSFSYDESSRLLEIDRPGTDTIFEYSANNIIRKIKHSFNTQIQSSVEYIIDNRNLITQKVATFDTTNFSYDSEGQLTNAVSPSINEYYEYDSLGNRIKSGSDILDYNDNTHRLTSDPNFVYGYDQNGNLIFKSPKNSSLKFYSFNYNSKNQLIKIQILSEFQGILEKEIEFAYDSIGRRFEKRVKDFSTNISKSRKFLYDGEDIIAELNGANQVLVKYLQTKLNPDDVQAMIVTQAGADEGIAPNPGSYFFLKDAAGSITDISDQTGNILQRHSYSSFGILNRVTDANNQVVNSRFKLTFSFTGREYDSDSGLYYLRARYYDPSIGRFLQSDPDPGKLSDPITVTNQYAYAGNNPISFSDPSGRFFLPILAVVGSLIATAVVVAIDIAITAAIAGAVSGLVGGALSYAIAIGSNSPNAGAAFVNGFTGGFKAGFTTALVASGAATAVTALGYSVASAQLAGIIAAGSVGAYQGYESGGPLGALLGGAGGALNGSVASLRGIQVGGILRGGNVFNNLNKLSQSLIDRFKTMGDFLGELLPAETPDGGAIECYQKVNCLYYKRK